MNKDLQTKFLHNTDDTGRHIVVSSRTGHRYAVEPIGDPHNKWGSIDPVTGKLMNKKGAGKFKGSIEPEESLITEENGFDNIVTIGPGKSPMAVIETLDAKYPDKV